MEKEELIKILIGLREEHRKLDDLIQTHESVAGFDQLSLQKMKRQKLLIKDKIALIKDQIMPDIIA